MATREVKYDNGEYNVTITLRTASVLDGMERTLKIESELLAQGREGENEGIRPAARFLRMYTYPNCISCVDSVANAEGAKKELPPADALTFEEFSALPEHLVILWHAATLELNPQWVVAMPESAEEAEGEESEPDKGSGSPRSSLSGSNSEAEGTSRRGTMRTKGTGA
jgi:hypothetical protein